jgi:thiamine-phosphate pyrophosphorylase
MLVTDRTLVAPGALVDVVTAAVAGGADLVQVREKDLPDEALLALARAIREAVGERAKVVVNGRPAVARAAGVGLHLPEAAPLPPASGVSALGDAPAASDPPDGGWPLWGRSVHDPTSAAAAVEEGAQYLVAGPFFETTSHPGAAPLGIDGLRRIVVAAGTVPVLAIGGLTPDRVAAAVAAGASGVAVRSDVLGAADPQRAAGDLRAAIDEALRPPSASQRSSARHP